MHKSELDMANMHNHYGFKLDHFTPQQLREFLNFRIDFLAEELQELQDAKTADDAVDALVDLCVIAIGTLQLYGVDAALAWNRVLEANMKKEVGVKTTRPQAGDLPDLVKPAGWTAPQHADNVGLLSKIYNT
jgi:predicted HAD superfamily Cof-like phosphohydrolase